MLLALALRSRTVPSLVVIPGRGVHSEGGSGVLQDAARRAVAAELGLTSGPVVGNAGRACGCGSEWAGGGGRLEPHLWPRATAVR